MADEPEVIRHQMEAQRASLADKLETLERQVIETMQGAKDAVTETVATVRESVKDSVDTVKGTLHDSVESVKETFDLPLQTRRHPWLMFGGAVAAGYVGGLLLHRLNPPPAYAPPSPRQRGMASFGAGISAPAARQPMAAPARQEVAPAPQQESPRQESWMNGLLQQFEPELQRLKGLAIGAAMGALRDVVSQSTPEPMRAQVADLIDGVTSKLGGQRVEGNVLADLLPQSDPHQGNGHHRLHEAYQS